MLDATRGLDPTLSDERRNWPELPESAKALARQTARQRDLDGWLLTLELPSYLPVLNYADDRGCGGRCNDAYCTRASTRDRTPANGTTGAVMERILALRHEVAQLLGFHDYSDYSLATKMADSPDQVLAFLDDLARRAQPQAQELDELRHFAHDRFGMDDLQAWDIGYYWKNCASTAIGYRRKNCAPTSHQPSAAGLFAVAERLFGIVIHPLDSIEVWHPDVRAYEIVDGAGTQRGRFYLDLYARPHKRGGAWMDGCHRDGS